MTDEYTVVTRKGQITVPVGIRRALGLDVGDRVSVTLDENGALQATLRPLRSVADATFGSITPRNQPEDIDELREIAMDDMARNAASEGRGKPKRSE